MNSKFISFLAAALPLLGALQAAQAAPVPGGCTARPEGATPMNIGPLNPINGFPLWVEDSTGLTVEMCLDPLLCISDPVIPGNAFSEQIGFGGEGFWASADAVIDFGNSKAILVTGVEAAFNTEIPIDGDQFPFTRLRIRVDAPLPGIYTVTHPWGKEVYNITAAANTRDINETFDISFAANTIGYQGRIGPILRWDTFGGAVGAPPAGFLGDPAVAHAVTGSPCGEEFNVFRVEAEDSNGNPVNIDPGDSDGNGSTSSVETHLFNVSGKVFTGVAPTALSVSRSTYARKPDSSGQVDIFATSDPDPLDPAILTVSGGPNLPAGENPLTAGENGLFYASLPLANASFLPKVVSVTANKTGKGETKLLRLLTDAVNITRAEYNLKSKVMTIEAVSSDLLNPPTLTAFGIGDLSNGKLTVENIDVVPDKVRVVSSAGGTDIEHVAVVEGSLPQARNDSYGTPQNTPLNVAAPGVLGNDSDPDGGALTAVLGTNVSNGTLALNADGSFSYTPNTDFAGVDSFTYTAHDGDGNSSSPATVTLNVTSTNVAPVAVNDTASTAEDTAVIIAVLGNDSDANGDALTVASVTPPTHGTAVINADNTISYTPALNYNGADGFSYTVSDGKGGTASATVSITVTPVNDNPTAVNDTATATAGSPVTVQVLGNDSDVDGNALTVSAVSVPANGQAVNNGTSVTYTPNANINVTTTDTFQYSISDGNGGTASATVTVTVEPVAIADTVTVSKAEFRVRDARWTIKGTAGANNELTIVSGPDLDGVVIGTVTANRRGAWSFSSRGGTAPEGDSISIRSSGGGELLNVTVSIR